MNKKKLFNDPIYGLIDYPYTLYYDIIDHPAFQRLRRISQTGLTSLVYPGATNTRFHHALGALHLITNAIQVLRSKGIEITHEEEEAVGAAMLLHDIGHGPFSHALEGILVPRHHETMSVEIMEYLNDFFEGRLDLCIEIFLDKYKKRFLHQLVSSQLDMDRMDYLMRDSYYTGVAEGTIGYDRLIKMLNVVDDQVVVEEKGIYSVEKFFIARRLMYWQVYLHKTSIVAESMLKKAVIKIKELFHEGKEVYVTPGVKALWQHKVADEEWIETFYDLDDSDVYAMLKLNRSNENYILQYICNAILNRRLFKIDLSANPIPKDTIETYINKVAKSLKIDEVTAKELVIIQEVDNTLYKTGKEEVLIKAKSGEILPFSHFSNTLYNNKEDRRYYICTPRL